MGYTAIRSLDSLRHFIGIDSICFSFTDQISVFITFVVFLKIKTILGYYKLVLSSKHLTVDNKSSIS